MGQKVLLTISLLASNRPDTIRKCLDSLAPIREALPSELILIDTSGNENIRRILEEYTDQIIPFQWCNDFAKARNEGLSRAKGEWFMFVDDDEWFIDCKEIIDFFTKGYYKICGSASYIVRSFLDEQQFEYSDSSLSRLFKMQEGIHFEGRVHEIITPVYGKRAVLNSVAEHSGYIYKTLEQRKAHFDRNCPLVLKMLEEDPYNMRWHKQLVQEYLVIEDYENLYNSAKRGLEIAETLDFTKKDTHMDIIRNDEGVVETLYIALIEALVRKSEFEECMEWCHKIYNDTRVGALCKAGTDLIMADCLYYKKEYHQAEYYIERYFKASAELPKNEKLYYVESSRLLVGNTFDKHKVIRAYSTLICCGLKQGKIEVLEKYLDRLKWDELRIYVHEDIVETIMESMLCHPEKEIFHEVLKLIVSHDALQGELYQYLKEWSKERQQEWNVIVEALADVPITNWHLLYIQAQSVKNHNKIAEHIKSLSLEAWLEIVRELVRALQWEDVEMVETYLQNSPLVEDSRFVYMQMALAEIRLVFDEKLIKKEELEEAFLDYAKKALHYYEDVEMLPPSGQAALDIMQAMAVSGTEECIRYLSSACEKYSSFTHPVQKYMDAVQVNRAETVSDEMQQLKLQILQQVFALIDAGNKVEALHILNQLQQMIPQDADVKELVEELK